MTPETITAIAAAAAALGSIAASLSAKRHLGRRVTHLELLVARQGRRVARLTALLLRNGWVPPPPPLPKNPPPPPSA